MRLGDARTSMPQTWKAALAANTRERQNGRPVVDCGGKEATYEYSIYRVENEHDIVIGPRLQNPSLLWVL